MQKQYKDNSNNFLDTIIKFKGKYKIDSRNINSGDIFIQKSPATTMDTLSKALLKLFDANNEIKIIGTRHSEKLYETLLTREEVQRAEDMGNYYRIPSDNRNLNYAQYFTEGELSTAEKDDYNSHNTERLDINSTTEALLKLDLIQLELKSYG